MSWQRAQILVVVLLLGGFGAHRLGRGPPDAAPASGERGPCEAAVVVERDGRSRLVCQVAAVQVLAALCPPDGPIHRGDRLILDGGRCRAAVRPLSARHRLRLGLRLDVNEEPAEALIDVPGIGPRTAQRIVAGRPWASVDALDAVRGIGPRRLADLRPKLRASPRPLLWPSRPRHAASSPRRP